MDGFEEKFRTYNTELSRLYTLYYNLSLHMSSLENRLLTEQRSELQSEVTQLQQSFHNFTRHLFNLEQIQVGTLPAPNCEQNMCIFLTPQN